MAVAVGGVVAVGGAGIAVEVTTTAATTVAVRVARIGVTVSVSEGVVGVAGTGAIVGTEVLAASAGCWATVGGVANAAQVSQASPPQTTSHSSSPTTKAPTRRAELRAVSRVIGPIRWRPRRAASSSSGPIKIRITGSSNSNKMRRNKSTKGRMSPYPHRARKSARLHLSTVRAFAQTRKRVDRR